MRRRLFLAPVILFMVLGLIGANLGHEAQARTYSKKGTHSVPVKKGAATVTRAGKKKATLLSRKAHVSKKKTRLASSSPNKKTQRAKYLKKAVAHRRSSTSKLSANLAEILEMERSSLQAYDLWLAKDKPDTFKRLTYEELMNSLTLSIVESAYTYVGVPYRWGGTTPDGFDCSGFVRHVFSQNGIKLGRSSRDQAREGTLVPLSELRPGDLIFFNMNRRNRLTIDHVGLYIGDGRFIHAASRHSREIKIEDLEGDRYLPKIVEVRRVVEYTR